MSPTLNDSPNPTKKVNVCVQISVNLIQDMTPEEQQQAIQEGLIIRGYRAGKLSMGEVAEILGLTYVEALEWFAQRGIPTWQKFPPELEDAAKENLRKLAKRLNLKAPE